MSLSLIKFSVFTLFCIGLAGCQQTGMSANKGNGADKAGAVSVNDQINQLSSLVAATRYLKSQCNRSDLPDESTINNVALDVAKQRGWDISNYQALPQRSESLYQGLLKDSTSQEAQCSEFNRTLAPFIDALRRQR
ncbi:type II secretion system protein S|uniref:Type II secretion system protein S n=1 Tax=Brenneria salicis ATCC 15712 = DSM 30166 TaxID=714314 RepID=A0A366IB42_9GAMM|nr:type II secretion system pilot lipoprotein GspS [Brenneria salicis]NMN90995.1 type II secretion system protein S [Brenneria salicis ATCC 15712 = DSM 30166]RBP66489.1 type II secretion system protein S [Brenneria salicis ATCC 15712 = DSM 30166]RLM32058.1 pullulanase [Brenneria salicis ATCC 15712 = DSM 30166]